MGITTISNGKKMVDEKTEFIIKFVYGHGVYGPFSENNHNVAVPSLKNNMVVSSEKKLVNRKTTFINMLVDTVRKMCSKPICFSIFKKLQPVSKIAGNPIRNVYL